VTLGQNPPAAAPSSPPPESAELIQRVSASIVRVTATFSYQEQEDPKLTSGFRESPLDPAATAQGGPEQTLTWTSAGTGFIIDSDGHIATANHIVSPLLNQQAAEKMLKKEGKILGPNSFQRATITVIVGDSVHKAERVYRKNDRLDIAILTCGGSTPRLPVPEFEQKEPRPGEPVSVSGFPSTAGSDVGNLTTSTGVVLDPVFKGTNGRGFYLAEVTANPGESGSPVFVTANGRIIGLVDANVNLPNAPGAGRIEIIPIREILSLLPSSR
jgi:hypothetical protein